MKKHAIIIMVVMMAVLLSAFVSAQSMLEISELTIEVNDDRQSADESGSGNIEITPEAEMKIKVQIENLFDRDVEGGEIEDIEVEVIIEDIDDDSDMEDTTSDFDLDPGKDKTVTLTFDMPLRLETDGTYFLQINVINGEDQNGTDHEVHLEFDVEVDKEGHELRWLRKELFPDKVSCTKSSKLLIDLINTGDSDEDVEFVIDGGELDYSKRLTFEMVEDIDDDENEYSFSDTLDLRDVDPGVYPITVRATYRDGREFLEDTLNLEVERCPADEPEPVVTPTPTPAPQPEPVVTPAPTTPETTQPTQVEVVSEPTATPYVRPAGIVATPKTDYTRDSWWDDNKWLVIVLVTNIVLIVAAIIVIVTILNKRR